MLARLEDGSLELLVPADVEEFFGKFLCSGEWLEVIQRKQSSARLDMVEDQPGVGNCSGGE